MNKNSSENISVILSCGKKLLNKTPKLQHKIKKIDYIKNKNLYSVKGTIISIVNWQGIAWEKLSQNWQEIISRIFKKPLLKKKKKKEEIDRTVCKAEAIDSKN